MTEESERMCRLLEHVFENIQHTRMHDMPMLNQELKVKAIGFEPWQQSHIGLLMTPWMMNILLLPQQDSPSTLRNGQKKMFALPSGDYEFVQAEEEEIGPYLSCSLFSPVFEFADQSTFELTAETALQAIMLAKNREVLGYEEWPSETAETAETADETAAVEPELPTERIDAHPQPTESGPVDRRGFFRRVSGAAQQSLTE